MSEQLFCSKCGTQRQGNGQFCSGCAAPFAGAATEVRAPIGNGRRNAGVLCFVASAIVAMSSFMPYVVITTALGLSFSRTPFQFGMGETLSYQGPLILLAAVFLAFHGLRMIGVVSPNKSLSRTQPLGVCIYGALVIIDAWTTSGWTNADGTAMTNVTRGYGGVVGLLGVAVGLLAIFVQRSSEN